MKTIQWQSLNTGGGCIVYGADLEDAPSITMSDECLIVIKDGMTFDEFWDAYKDEIAEQENLRGMIWFSDNLFIIDFHRFLLRHNLAEYLGAIIDKHRMLMGGAYGK